ncbi:MAG: Sua5/YciO/YrdC/YwlC family protein [Acidobacteria bacterium]|nr:Sua5/YciO/YrdC/YwlC family protein [Acidobacteriota bacterium]
MQWQASISWLQSGGALAYPTDTLWGLGCRADDPGAVLGCLSLKGPDRQANCSVIVPIMLLHEIADVPDDIDRFLPGPYTLILPLKDKRYRHLAQGETIGVRRPDCPDLLQTVDALGVPLVTTSLNAHGQSPAHDLLEAKQVAESWGIPCIEQSFDAVGPSTILLWRDGWEVLRRGIGIMP